MHVVSLVRKSEGVGVAMIAMTAMIAAIITSIGFLTCVSLTMWSSRCVRIMHFHCMCVIIIIVCVACVFACVSFLTCVSFNM